VAVNRHILVVGYYGFDNAGDEALLYQSVKLLKRNFPEAKISALYNPKSPKFYGGKPFSVSRLFGEWSGVNRWNPFRILQAIWMSDAVVFGGGGLFQDATSRKSFWYYASILYLAQFFGKKTYLVAQGIGPFHHESSRKNFISLTRRLSGFSVRDEESAEWCREHGCTLPIIASDLVFYGAKPWVKYDFEKAPVAGICLRPSSHLSVISECINTLQQDISLIVINPNDVQASSDLSPDKIMDTLFISNLMVHEESQNDGYRVEFLIGMRYHACVWAALRGIPFMAVSDDPKLHYLAKSFGQPFVDISDASNTTSLKNCLEDFLHNRFRYEQDISEKVLKLIQQCEKNNDIFSYD
jgi:polysaccharide pyruvyl transferase CsaB